MNIFDFITQDEIDETPDDPDLAFTHLVRRAQYRLAEETKQLPDEQWAYETLKEARLGFVNIVTALGKSYQIEPFASMEVPRYKDFDDGVHRQFKADLDHYMTQLLINNSIRGKRDSVGISIKAKDRIRSYINGLKGAIENANFTDAKRASLLAKLSEFEAALDKNRLNLLAVTKIAIEIMAIPGALWASYDVVSKLTTNILQVVGEAKTIEDEQRQLSPSQPIAALTPPRKEERPFSKDGPDEMDDEIPF